MSLYAEMLVDRDHLLAHCRNKKILILDTFMWTPHFETSLELRDFLLDSNITTVHELFWLNGKIEDRWDYRRKIFRYGSLKIWVYFYRQIRNCGIRGFFRSIATQFRTIFGKTRSQEYMDQEETEDAIMSSALSLFQTSSIGPVQFETFKRKMLRSLDRVSLWAERCIAAEKPDVVIIFNGRFASSRLLRRLAAKREIPFVVHERGADKDRFSLWFNGIPHDPKLVSAGCRAVVEKLGRDGRDVQSIGREFFENRRQGNTIGWRSFMHDYESDELKSIAASTSGSRLVVYFTSTEDEFKALRKDLPPLGELGEQIDAINAVHSISTGMGYRFLLRLHPNLATRPAAERDRYPKGEFVIEPDRKISSYGLIRIANYVLTHNSQIALEGAALGCPSAFTGRSRFEDLACAEKCFDADSVAAFLESSPASDDLICEANRVGSYLATFGLTFERYSARTLSRGKYGRVDLNWPWSLFGK